MAEQELLSNSMAAKLLHELMSDKSAEQWEVWLRNNRKPERRVTYHVPYVKLGGGVFYDREELAKFAEWEKGRQLGSIKLTGRAAEVMRAFGIGEKGGSTTGRKLKVTGINPQVDEATGKPFIQFVVDDPLMVYRVEVEESKALLREWADAIQACERMTA
jgi:hypothetical protein